MTNKESRERCFQNAMAMFAVLNLTEPKRAAHLSVGKVLIELSVYFDKDETKKKDKIVAMLITMKLDWADYSENYFEDGEFFSARFTWEIVD